MSDLFWLSEAQVARLAPLLPRDTRGVPRVDDRRVISGIVQVLRTGGRWADAPREYGPRKTLYNRFVRWAARGVWRDVFEALAASGGPPSTLMLDSTHAKVCHAKAHRCAAGGRGGRASGDRGLARRAHHEAPPRRRRVRATPRHRRDPGPAR